MAKTEWTGDLADDCWLTRGEWFVHVEKMHHCSWWLAIHHDDGYDWNASEYGIRWTSGRDARLFAEWFIENVGDYMRGKP